MSTETVIGGIEDPRYQQAVNMFESANYDGAADLLSDLLEDTVNKYGELDLATGPIYYKYGSVLIEKVNFDNKGAFSVDMDEDLKIAWECLESARCIYSKNNANDYELTRVLLRLSDISFMTSNYETAIKDSETALTMRQKIQGKNDKSIADAESTLAIAYFYGAKDKVAEYLNNKDDIEYEEEMNVKDKENHENPDDIIDDSEVDKNEVKNDDDHCEVNESQQLEEKLNQASKYMSEACKHYKESSRIFKYIACQEAIECGIINSSYLNDNISDEAIQQISDKLNQVSDPIKQEELENYVEIAKDLDEKVCQTEKWKVEDEIEQNELENEDEDDEDDEDNGEVVLNDEDDNEMLSEDEFDEELEDDPNNNSNKRTMDDLSDENTNVKRHN